MARQTIECPVIEAMAAPGSSDGVSRLQAAARSWKPEEELKTSQRRPLRSAAGYVRSGPLTGDPPPFGVDRAAYSAPAKGKHDGYWLGSTAGAWPGYHMRGTGSGGETDRAGLRPEERYSGKPTPEKGHPVAPGSGGETQLPKHVQNPAGRGQMESQAWREGKVSEVPLGRAPGQCPGVDHLQGSSCVVPKAEAQRRLAGLGETPPYRVVDTAARTVSQAPEHTQQRVDPTAKPVVGAAALEARVERFLGPGQSAASVQAGFALPCNRATRAQMQADRMPYPQIHHPGQAAAEATYSDAGRSCMLGRLRGQGCPDLLTPRSAFPASA